jgi:hypothetical protein
MTGNAINTKSEALELDVLSAEELDHVKGGSGGSIVGAIVGVAVAGPIGGLIGEAIGEEVGRLL